MYISHASGCKVENCLSKYYLLTDEMVGAKRETIISMLRNQYTFLRSDDETELH